MTLDKSKPIQRVQKGWGYEDWLHNDHKYCGKILMVNGGLRCSLHYHEKKTETFYCRSGWLWVRILHDVKGWDLKAWGCTNFKPYEQIFTLQAGDVLELEPGVVHQFGGIEKTSEIIEFSTQHFEDDSYRLEKGD